MKNIRIAFAILAAALVPLMLFPQTPPDVKAFDQTRFDFAFTRADRATDMDRWMEEARRGVSVAASAWERTAEALYSDPAEFDQARSAVAAWSEESLEKRFASWLSDRFFGREAARLKAIVERESAAANARLLYRTDADGNILYDQATGDPLLIRPDEEGNAGFSADLDARRAELREGAGEALLSYRSRLEGLRPELLSYIAEDRRDGFAALLSGAEMTAQGRAAVLIDSYLAQEERLFVVKRTEDIQSLRQKSESAAASAVAEDLSRETAASCEKGIEDLRARVEAASAGTGDLAVAGSDWLAEFKTQFDRGLSAWTAAEERFMARRLEWERDAALAFDKGNETWAAAFERLGNERRVWEEKARALLISGQETFSRASETLERSISDARAEFERDAALRGQASADRARAWVDSYLTCGSVVTGARESIEFWLNKIGWTKGNDPGFADSGFSAWLETKRQALGGNSSFDEIDRWTALYAEYLEKARRARDALIGDFGLALGSGVGDLRDVLDANVSSEVFHLDEYQVELLRAKAVAGYWAKRVGIAEAVAAYASERSAGRATEAESLAAWNAAKASYDAATASYAAAQAALTAASSGVSEARDAVVQAAAALAEADRVLEELNSEYALKMSVYALGSNDFLKADIVAVYQDLLERRRLQNGTGADAPYAVYLERAKTLGREESLAYAGETLRQLVTGNGGVSLSELDRRAEAIEVPPSASEPPADLSSYGIAQGDEAYRMIAAFLADRDAALAALAGEGPESEAEREDLRAAYGELIVRTVQDAKREAREAVEERLDSIALLSAADGRSWYSARTGGAEAEADLRATLNADIEKAEREALRVRVLLERNALRVLLDPDAVVSDDARTLARFGAFELSRAAEALSALDALAAVLEASAGLSAAEYAAAVEALSGEEEEALGFAQGGGYFADPCGASLSAVFLGEQEGKLERARARKNAYERYASVSAGCEEELRLSAWKGIRTALSAAGVPVPAQGLPTTASIGAALRADAEGAESALASLLVSIDAAAAAVPRWVTREIQTWRAALVSFSAARARYDGASCASAASLASSLAAETERRTALSAALSALAASDASGVRPLCDALDTGAAAGLADYGGISRDRLEDEIVRRVSRSLAAAAGSLGEADDSAIREAVENDASASFSFVGAALRSRAVDAALTLDAIRRASANQAAPETLAPSVREARLAEIFQSFDREELSEIAASCLSTESLASRYLSAHIAERFASDVDAETFRSALVDPPAEGEPSWLETATAVEGEDLGAALEVLIEAAYANGVDFSRAAALDRLNEAFSASLESARSRIESIRTAEGGASEVKERALSLLIAAASPDQAYLSAVLAVLSPRGVSDAAALQDAANAEGFDLTRETFFGLASNSPYALEAARSRLSSLLLSGRGGAYEEERAIALSLSGGNALVAETDALRSLLRTASSYAGPEISGDAFAWARSKDPSSPLALADLLLSGCLPASGDAAPPSVAVNGALQGALSAAFQSSSDAAAMLGVSLEYANAFQAAAKAEADAAAAGRNHWRAYLRAGVAEGLDSLAPGNPEAAVGEDVTAPRAAASWTEGALADAVETAESARAAASAAFSAWQELIEEQENAEGADGAKLAAFRSAAFAYLGDASSAWTESGVFRASATARDGYETAYRRAATLSGNETVLHTEFSRLGAVLSDTSAQDALKAELAELGRRILDCRAAYDAATASYRASADTFAAAGAAYDASYGSAKTSYAAVENARNAYEREDAIRRWSSTSYLAAENDLAAPADYRDPQEELAYTRSRRDRAGIALSALEGLYSSDAEARPYADAAYQALYDGYRASFTRVLLTVRARDALMAGIAEEAANNQKRYEAYFQTAFAGSSAFTVPDCYDGYAVKTEAKDVEWKDLLRLTNGSLRIARDADFNLSQTCLADAESLKAYFKTAALSGSDTVESTAFERDLRAWSARIASYDLSGGRFYQWGLARDYLLRKLIDKNAQYTSINGTVDVGNDLLTTAGSYQNRITEFQNETDIIAYYSVGCDEAGNEMSQPYFDRHGLPYYQAEAWNSLSASEKEDLEFYLALTLAAPSAGPAQAQKAFELGSQLAVYEDFDQFISDQIRKTEWSNGGLFGWGWFDFSAVYDAIKDRYIGYLEMQRVDVPKGGSLISSAAAELSRTYDAYAASSAKLAALKGESAGPVTWSLIQAALQKTGQFSAAEITTLSGYYAEFTAGGGALGSDSSTALAALARRERNKREDAQTALETAWNADETARDLSAAAYRETAARFVEGNATRGELDSAARAAYGQDAPSLKTHLSNLGDAASEAAFSQLGSASAYADLYAEAADDYALLIERAARSRIEAERAAREDEWSILRVDLSEKQRSWQTAANLIIERGLADWKKGQETMNERYAQWRAQFKAQYQQSDNAWNLAMLQSLEEKEAWVRQSAIAADKASKGAILALVGADAEAAVRRMDTLNFTLLPASGAEEARTTLGSVLSLAGIARLGDAFSGLSGSADTAAKAVRTGLGGASAWDSAKLQAAAAEFARKTNEELAARQARILAARAKESAAAAVKGLVESVDNANRNFRASMDDTFVYDGKWSRQGNSYTKEVVVHSTLWEQYITENAYVEGFIAYTMNPWTLETDLSDGALANLDYRGIQALIARAQDEVARKSHEVFGKADDSENAAERTKEVYFYRDVQIGTRTEKQIDECGNEYEVSVPVYESQIDASKTVKKTWGAGEFGSHIGFDPTLKESPDANAGISDIWQDEGMGELGRLLRSYIYWSLKEAKGYAEANKPFYEKSMWDDRGDWFKAPTVRGVVDVGVTVAAAVVSGGSSLPAMLAAAAINMADDAIFTMADVSSGYKSWEQAGLDFGKKALSSAASIAVGGVFNGFDGAAGFFSDGLNSGLQNVAGLDGVIGRTMMGGLQTMTTSTVTSAINAVQWTGSGLGWSSDAFSAGVQGGLASAATGMTSTFTSGALGLLNSGQGMLSGFSSGNIGDVGKLNSFIGGLAGQTVNWALSGDFALNVANFNMFGIAGADGKTLVSSGVLELHLGKNGITMNIGTGGAEASLGTIASAMSGLSVLGTNSWINSHVAESGLNIAAVLRAQYGFGDAAQRGQMWDIVKGRTRLNAAGSTDQGPEAYTDTTDGTRVVTMTGYHDNMSIDEQLRMAAVLGYEAYRDGVRPGEIQADGTYETGNSNFAEIKEGTIARIVMSNKVDADYTGFLAKNQDFAFDSYLYGKSKELGDDQLFDTYLQEAFKNDADYYWPVTSTNGKHQSNPAYKSIPLLNAKSKEVVDQINQQRLAKSVEAYKTFLARREGYSGELSKFTPKNSKSDVELAKAIEGNEGLQQDFGYSKMPFESLYAYGCMLTSAVYGADAASGKSHDIADANKKAKEMGLYLGESDLSKELLGKLMGALTDGMYRFDLVSLPNGKPSQEMLQAIASSPEMYLAHLRIKKNGNGNAYHSELLSQLDWQQSYSAHQSSATGVFTANPWAGGGYTANTYRKMNEIARWDVYKVTPTWKYYRVYEYSSASGR